VADRNLARNNLIYYLKVLDVASGRRLGYLADITTAGLMLMTDGPLTAGTAYRLKIEPPLARKRGKAIVVDAVTKWSDKDKLSSFHRTGFEMTDISLKDVAAIRALINDYRYEEPDEDEPRLPSKPF
jgi:hypothetical protein